MAQYTFPTSKLGLNGTAYYAMGGLTLEIDPEVSGSPSGVWVNMGPIINFTPNVNLETYDHYDARPGTQVKDLSVVISKSFSFTFTSEELNPFVMSALLLASGYEEPGTTVTVTDESTTFGSDDFAPLQHTPLASPAPVVTDTAGTTTYTAGTDYEVVVAPDGFSYLYRLSGGTITAGQTVLVDYSYASGTETVLTPLTADEIVGKVRLTFRAGPSGKNWRYQHTKGSLKPTGTAAFNATEVSTAEFTLDALYDSAATVTVNSVAQSAPFGYLQYDITI